MLVVLAASAQEIRVLSEFRRVDSTGQIVTADAVGSPREILSPALVRNGYSSFRIVMELPAGAEVWLEVAQNPENSVAVTLYEEEPGGRLRKVPMPYLSKLPPGITTATLWMDLWVKPDAPIDRIKIEPQMRHAGHWYIYPMEARIVKPAARSTSAGPAPNPPAGSAADAAVMQLLRERLCGTRQARAVAATPSHWQFTRRNAAQDLSLGDRAGWERALLKASGAASVHQWCTAPPRNPSGPEWVLRFRDLLYRAAGAE